MNSPLQRIIESKRALRLELAALPVAEKLRILDVMRLPRNHLARNFDSMSAPAPQTRRGSRLR